jgi:hypothetical protein
MCTCVLVVAEFSYWPAGYAIPWHSNWNYKPTYLLYSYFLVNIFLFFLLTFLFTLFPLYFVPSLSWPYHFPLPHLQCYFLSSCPEISILFSHVASSASLKTEVIGSLKKSVNFSHSTDCHIPEGSILLNSISTIGMIWNNKLLSLQQCIIWTQQPQRNELVRFCNFCSTSLSSSMSVKQYTNHLILTYESENWAVTTKDL